MFCFSSLFKKLFILFTYKTNQQISNGVDDRTIPET